MKLFSVTLLSKYTSMVVRFESVKAATQQEANNIAIRCMANDHAAWVAE